MSADAVGAPRSTVHAVTATGESAGQFTVDEQGNLTIDSEGWTEAEVNVANGLNSADFPLEENLGMTISTDEEGVADVEFVDEDGNVIGEFAVDDETENGMVMDSTVEFDAETGDFDVTEEAAEPEDVDEDALAWLADMSADEGSEDSTEPSDGSMDVGDSTDGDGAGSEESNDAGSGDADDPGTDSEEESGSDPVEDPQGDSGADSEGDSGADSEADPGAEADE